MPTLLAQHILLLLSTTVSEACWTTVTHELHEKEVVKYLPNKIKQKSPTFVANNTSSLQLRISTAISGQWSAGGAILTLTFSKVSRHAHQKQTKQTKPMKKRLPLPAIYSVSFEMMKTTSALHAKKKKKTQNSGPIMFASLSITPELKLEARLRFHRNQ